MGILIFVQFFVLAHTDMNALETHKGPGKIQKKRINSYSASRDDAKWEGMGDVGSARYESALLPPCPNIRVLSCSN